MKVLLNLCLLFSLISPAVVLLTCETVVSLGGFKFGETRKRNCNSKSICRSFNFSSNVFYEIGESVKSCTPSTECDPGYYSVSTSGGGYLKMLVDCCATNNCNSKPLNFSSEPMEPNGLECKGCRFKGMERCKRTEKVKCLGEQTKCIDMKITYIKQMSQYVEIFGTKGCATPLMCDQRKLTRNMNLSFLKMSKITLNCSDAILAPNKSRLA